MNIKLLRKFRSLLSIAREFYNRQRKFHSSTFTYGFSALLASVLVTGGLLGIRHVGDLQSWLRNSDVQFWLKESGFDGLESWLNEGHFGGLQSLELAAFDQMVRLRKETKLDDRLLIVGINDADIQNQKQWPLSDEVVANLLGKLQEHQPKVIGLDLYRDVPYQNGYEKLVEELQQENVIVITQIGRVPPPKNIPVERIGFNDFVIDEDNVLRRNWMVGEIEKKYGLELYEQIRVNGQSENQLKQYGWTCRANNEVEDSQEEKTFCQIYSFSLRLSLSFLDNQNQDIQLESDFLKINKTNFKVLNPNSGGYQMSPGETGGWQILLNYRSDKYESDKDESDEDKKIAETISLTQLLEKDPNELDELIKGKVVIVGTTAPSENDLFATPYSKAKDKNHLMPGVIVHAQLVSQILSTVLDNKPLFWFWTQWQEGIWIWGWALAGGIISWRFQHPLSLGSAIIGSLGGLTGFSFFLFTQAGWVPVVTPALGLIVTSGSILAYKVLYKTYHDTLTGLPNRALFTKQLQQAKKRIQQKKQNSFLAVLFLDLDRFKMINESFGHQAGDQLLVITVSRLKSYLGSANKVARVGGDEFAILLSQLSDVDEATKIADQLQKELTLPIDLNGQEVSTTLSIGIAFNQPGQEFHSEDLIRDAHTAMNRAKALGKARHEVFATGMHTQAVTRLQLENDLRQAIKHQEFQLYYQPIILLETGSIAGFEALVRWQSSERGFVSPGEFIPIAEETGMIVPLGQWILLEACRQMHCWHEQFPQNPPFMISVNLSSRQFSQPDLVEQIEQALAVTGLDNYSLKLEITESMVMNNVESAIALLKRLKDLNIKLSIDDFGTGYSSLSYLHRFPMDTLKVDQSFVRRMDEVGDDAEIVNTIVMLGHNLGMDLIAEGIETEAQKKALQALKCEYGQGYFFSKPLPSEAVEELLKGGPQW